MRRTLFRLVAVGSLCLPAGALAYDAGSASFFQVLKAAALSRRHHKRGDDRLYAGRAQVAARGHRPPARKTWVGKMARRTLLAGQPIPRMRCATLRDPAGQDRFPDFPVREHFDHRHRGGAGIGKCGRDHRRAQPRFRIDCTRRRSGRWQFADTMIIKGLMLAILLASPAKPRRGSRIFRSSRMSGRTSWWATASSWGSTGPGTRSRGSPFTSQSIQSMLDRMDQVPQHPANAGNPLNEERRRRDRDSELPPFANEGAGAST